MPVSLSDYTEKFWLMLNGVTAFAAAQGIATSTANWSHLKNNSHAIIGGLLGDLVTSILYSIVVWWLTKKYLAGVGDVEPSARRALDTIFWGRLFVIWLFGIYAALALYGGYRNYA